MDRVRKLPGAFAAYQKIGGALDFAVFHAEQPSECDLTAAIGVTVGQPFDAMLMASMGSRARSRRDLLGDWYEPSTGKLIKRGSYTLRDGREITDPKLENIPRKGIMSGATVTPLPAAGPDGGLAYAFANPPYTLSAAGERVQELFDTIFDFIMPKGVCHEIRDWTHPDLPRVSPYFAPGMEWWGVFLFTIHVPSLARLTVIAGSTTD
ncbi:hypothetical protein [Sphingomonas sp.]|uniref:hypothetical protein n=1 Tax=Sphingomonas sp. TaxID=28214 RepID=UPI003F722290